MEISKLDSNLLRRVGRLLVDVAEDQDARVAAAVSGKNMRQAKVEKAEADRQHRDIRDIDALRQRLDTMLKASPAAWAIFNVGNEELVDVVMIKPENLEAGVRAEPLYL